MHRDSTKTGQDMYPSKCGEQAPGKHGKQAQHVNQICTEGTTETPQAGATSKPALWLRCSLVCVVCSVSAAYLPYLPACDVACGACLLRLVGISLVPCVEQMLKVTMFDISRCLARHAAPPSLRTVA